MDKELNKRQAMRASEGLEEARKSVGGRSQRQRSSWRARYNLRELRSGGMSFGLQLKEVLVNEERCEGRNEKQGGSGSSNRSL